MAYDVNHKLTVGDAKIIHDSLKTNLASVNHNLQLQVEDLKQALYGSVVDGAVDSYAKLDSAPLNASVTVDGSAYPVARGTRLMLNKVAGRTEKWNQLVKNSVFSTTNDWSPMNTALSVNGGILTQTGWKSDPSARAFQQYSFVVGHKYFMRCEFCSNFDTTAGIYPRANDYIRVNINDGEWVTQRKVITVTSSSQEIWLIWGNDNEDYSEHTLKCKSPIVIDLTAIFGSGSEPSSVDDPRIAEIEAIALAHPEYDAGSLHSPVVSGLSVTGKNLLSVEPVGEWLSCETVGDKLGTGSSTASITYERFPVKKGITYVVSWDTTGNTSTRRSCIANSDNIVLQNFYLYTTQSDTNGYYVFTAQQDGYLWFSLPSNANHVQLEVGTSATPYEQYREQTTITIPSTTLRGVGTAKDNIVAVKQEDGLYDLVKTVTMGEVDLGTLSWTKAGTNRFYTSGISSLVNPPSADTVVANITCPIYVSATFNDAYYERENKSISVTDAASVSHGNVSVVDTSYTDSPTFKSAMSGVIMEYELVTPVTTTIATGLTYAEVTALNEGGLISAINTESAYVQPDVDIDVVIRKAVESNA